MSAGPTSPPRPTRPPTLRRSTTATRSSSSTPRARATRRGPRPIRTTACSRSPSPAPPRSRTTSPPSRASRRSTALGNKRIINQTGSGFAAPPLHAADFNRLAYNPAVTYNRAQEGRRHRRSPARATDANGNYAYNAIKWATQSVERDPFHAYEVAAGAPPMWAGNPKDNLARVAVPLYCNTDWPLTRQRAQRSRPPRSTPVTANGQYAAGSRAPGAASTAHPTMRPPPRVHRRPPLQALEMGYNYPWQKSSGSEDAKYFYRQLSNKTLWCDNTSPWYPRNTRHHQLQRRHARHERVRPATVQQAGQSLQSGSRPGNYTPAGMRTTDPPALYCVPGTGGSGSGTPGTGSLPECLACNCIANTDPVRRLGRCSITNAACDATTGSVRRTRRQHRVPGSTRHADHELHRRQPGVRTRPARLAAACCSILTPTPTRCPPHHAARRLQRRRRGVPAQQPDLRHHRRAGGGGLFTYARTNIGDVDPANKAGGVTPKGYPLTQTGAFTTRQSRSGCPVGRHDGTDPSPLLRDRHRRVLRQPHRDRERPVARIRRGELPGQERPAAVQAGQVRASSTASTCSRATLGIPRQRQLRRERDALPEGLPDGAGQPRLARHRHADARHLRVDQLRELVRVLLDAPECRQVDVGHGVLVPDQRPARSDCLSRGLSQPR